MQPTGRRGPPSETQSLGVPLEYRGSDSVAIPGAAPPSCPQKAGRGMTAYMALIERSNHKDIRNVEVQVTITDLSPGRQSWRGEFVSRSADAILPNERLALTFDTGQKGHRAGQ